MLIIGICGASGSGKSTLARELCQEIGAQCIVINHDSYYSDHSYMSFEERCKVNYDEPSAFDHNVFLEDMRSLLAGKPITRKRYDFTRHCRCDSDELIQPPQILIVEGIHAFYDSRARDLMFLKIYVNVEPDICLLRRIERDINERGRCIENISDQYLTTVKPMFEQYIRHYIDLADVIVAHGGKNAKIVSILGGYVRHELRKRDILTEK